MIRLPIKFTIRVPVGKPSTAGILREITYLNVAPAQAPTLTNNMSIISPNSLLNMPLSGSLTLEKPFEKWNTGDNDYRSTYPPW